jgi:hypothetical protein
VEASRFIQGPFKGVVVSWTTDELADSRVFFGPSRPPAFQKHDGNPKRSHTFRLPATAKFLAVESRDAAGNATIDMNDGAYYEPAPDGPDELGEDTQYINELVRIGDLEGAAEATSALIGGLTESELEHALAERALPDDDLQAGFSLLTEFLGVSNGGLTIVAQGEDFIECTADSDLLAEGTYLDLPDETLVAACDRVLTDLIARIRPTLTLEVTPRTDGRRYKLRRI